MTRNKRAPRKAPSKTSKRSGASILFKILKWLILLGLFAGVVGVSALASIFYYYGRDLPELLKRDDYEPQQISRVYAASGEMIGEFFYTGGRRTVVALEDIPQIVQFAFMAAEDADFMVHSGIDYIGMVRAFYLAARHDTGLKGTSTITQQLVKNIILTPERSYQRKIQEIILARELERNLTKQDILYMYLNTIYLGHGNNGVEEASQFLFGKSIKQVNLTEAALLAGMTQSPERLTPLRHPEAAKRRRSYVLRQLWEKGFIEEAAYRAADEAPIVLADRAAVFPDRGKAPYFNEYVRKSLVERYGEEKVYTGGLRIHTTLDLKSQEAAELAVRVGLRDYDTRRKFYRPQRKLADKDVAPFVKKQTDGLKGPLETTQVYEALVTAVDAEKNLVEVQIGPHKALQLSLEPRTRVLGEGKDVKALAEAFQKGHVVRVMPFERVGGEDQSFKSVRFEPGPEGALISIDPFSREVVALVGGYSFAHNQYDNATQARRQTGSAFKSLVFGAALEEKIITPSTLYLDSPTVFQMHAGKTWSPKNADGQWRGPVRVREALASSRNVVAVRVLDDVTIPKAIAFARKIGVKSPLVDNYTMVMGSSEMPPIEITNVYATFASGGLLGEPRYLRRVESVRGHREVFTTETQPVIAPEVAYLLTSILISAVDGYINREGKRAAGTAGSLRAIGHPFAGKTGTTNESKDAWFIGYTPKNVTGVWVGFSDNRSLGDKEYGGRVATPIFGEYMKAVLKDTPPVAFEPPTSGLTSAQIDPATGKLSRAGGFDEIFLIGTAPTDYATSSTDNSAEDFIFDQFKQ
ncbi:MAG: PBP1A family penicillin-binding protein [Bradymonadaceae bacterium]|nr:PBP1A family penicillin-binding protein [Lujinxingiaceae bacterium]